MPASKNKAAFPSFHAKLANRARIIDGFHFVGDESPVDSAKDVGLEPSADHAHHFSEAQHVFVGHVLNSNSVAGCQFSLPLLLLLDPTGYALRTSSAVGRISLFWRGGGTSIGERMLEVAILVAQLSILISVLLHFEIFRSQFLRKVSQGDGQSYLFLHLCKILEIFDKGVWVLGFFRLLESDFSVE